MGNNETYSCYHAKLLIYHRENVCRISNNSTRGGCRIAGPTHCNLMIWVSHSGMGHRGQGTRAIFCWGNSTHTRAWRSAMSAQPLFYVRVRPGKRCFRAIRDRISFPQFHRVHIEFSETNCLGLDIICVTQNTLEWHKRRRWQYHTWWYKKRREFPVCILRCLPS